MVGRGGTFFDSLQNSPLAIFKWKLKIFFFFKSNQLLREKKSRGFRFLVEVFCPPGLPKFNKIMHARQTYCHTVRCLILFVGLLIGASSGFCLSSAVRGGQYIGRVSHFFPTPQTNWTPKSTGLLFHVVFLQPIAVSTH